MFSTTNYLTTFLTNLNGLIITTSNDRELLGWVTERQIINATNMGINLENEKLIRKENSKLKYSEKVEDSRTYLQMLANLIPTQISV